MEKIKAGMYILNDSPDLSDYYERPLKEIYMIIDSEDLLLGLHDWLESYSYRLAPKADLKITQYEKIHYEIQVEVLSVTEMLCYTCYLIHIPNAKNYFQHSADQLPNGKTSDSSKSL